MPETGWLWIVFTLLAAAAQTIRNATQRELTATLGTAGATHVRFLFGFPFAVLFLAVLLLVTGASLPTPPLVFWPWVFLGMGAQIAATALMLAAMEDRSFVVTIAYIKTEPVQVALFGLIFLGDALSIGMIAAILIATAGVIVMSLKPGGAPAQSWRPTLLGLSAGAMFALSAVGYRGAILSLGLSDFVMAATFTLVDGPAAAGGDSVGLSDAAQPRRDARDPCGLAPVAVRGLHGRDRLAILVSRLRARDGCERAHAGAGRGAVRAGDLKLRVRAQDHGAGRIGDRADRGRRRAADLDALIPKVGTGLRK